MQLSVYTHGAYAPKILVFIIGHAAAQLFYSRGGCLGDILTYKKTALK